MEVHSDPDEVPFNNGLYFFYEEAEKSSHDNLARIVRVGNHPRSQDRLCGRLWDHYSPNKNFSVFRRLLGGALLRRENGERRSSMPQACFGEGALGKAGRSCLSEMPPTRR